MRRWAIVLVTAALLVTGAPPGGAGDGDRAVSGPFTSDGVLPPACPSFLCTEGRLEGDLAGTYWFVMETLTAVPTGDPARPVEQVYTGRSTITLDNGDVITGVDHGRMWPGAAPGTTDFVTTVVLQPGGTGDLADVVGGEIVASGTLDLLTAHAVGSYEGVLCETEACAAGHVP